MNVSRSRSRLSVTSTDEDRGPGKHVGGAIAAAPPTFLPLPSSLKGRIKVEKVCGEDKRDGWLAEMARNANLFWAKEKQFLGLL